MRTNTVAKIRFVFHVFCDFVRIGGIFNLALKESVTVRRLTDLLVVNESRVDYLTNILK